MVTDSPFDGLNVAVREVGREDGARDDVVRQDGRELVLVLLEQQLVERALGKCLERRVGRREDGERALVLERLDELGGGDGGHQCGQVCGGDGRLDDVGGVVIAAARRDDEPERQCKGK
jgi:hypothetical protein